MDTCRLSVVRLSPVSNWFVEKRQMYHNLLLNWCFAQKATDHNNNWQQTQQKPKHIHFIRACPLRVCTVLLYCWYILRILRMHQNKNKCCGERKNDLHFKVFQVGDKCIMFTLCDNNTAKREIYRQWIPDGWHCNRYVVRIMYIGAIGAILAKVTSQSRSLVL